MNVLIVEDEPKIATLLKEMIETNHDWTVIYICQTIEGSVLYLTKNQAAIDLIFMDIELADGISFEIFNQISVVKPVIFCTAFSGFMLQAFKNSGIDYILKPFDNHDIDTALKKIITLKNSLAKVNPVQPAEEEIFVKFPHLLISRFRERIIPVLVQEIAIFFLKNGIVHLKTFNGEQSIISKTLDDIELITNPNDFFRINRQIIVHRKVISHITPLLSRKLRVNIVMDYPEELIVSRLKVAPFKEWGAF